MELLFVLGFPVSVGGVHSLMIGAVMAKGEKGFKNGMIFVFFCPFYKIVCLRACVRAFKYVFFFSPKHQYDTSPFQILFLAGHTGLF